MGLDRMLHRKFRCLILNLNTFWSMASHFIIKHNASFMEERSDRQDLHLKEEERVRIGVLMKKIGLIFTLIS